MPTTFTLAETQTGVASVLVGQGSVEEALVVLERAHALVRTWDHQPSAVLARLGQALALSGRPREARELLEEVARSATTVSSMGVGRAMQLVWLGDADRREGRLDDARRHAQEALALAQKHQERAHEAWALHLLGVILARGDDPSDLEKAQGYNGDALALAAELGMRPLMAHCHLALGRLFQESRQELAREQLALATALYREMDMRGGQDEAAAEIRRLE